MTPHALPLDGAFIVKTNNISDHRGSFTRLFCTQKFNSIGLNKNISQINFSKTINPGTIRGMHYQKPPYAETKIVRCLKGSIFDVIIDLRVGSPTYLHWYGKILNKKNMLAMYIPEGFAHGFQALEHESETLYLHTEPYNPAYERAVRFDDPAINIKWPLPPSNISEKDKNHPLLDKEFEGIQI